MDRALALNPGYTWALGTKGEALRQMGRHEEAIQVLDQALAANPEYVFALTSKGEALRQLDRYEEAIQAFDQALALRPDYDWALGSKGEALRQLGRYEEALTFLNQAVSLDPGYAWALGRQGETLHTLERYEEALEAFDRALELSPEDAWVLPRKGEALRMLNRHEEALAVFDQALEASPDEAWIWASKGETLRMLDRYEEALEAEDWALELSPGYAWATAAKGQALLGLGRNEDAVETLKAALELEPENAWALAGMANALQQLDRYRESLEAIERAVELAPYDAWNNAFQGVMLLGTAHHEEALALLQRAVEQDPTIDWAQSHLGRTCYRLAGKHRQAMIDVEREQEPATAEDEKAAALELYKKAVEAAERAVVLNSGDTTWHTWLAESLRGLERKLPERAQYEYQWVIDTVGEMESLDHWAAGDAGWCHYRLGNHEAAERLLVEALGLKRDEPRSRTTIGLQLDLAQVVLLGGRYTLGLQQYSKALDLAGSKEPLVRRGLLDWSLFELEYETSQNKKLAEIPQVKRVLSIMYEAAGRCCYELGDWATAERMLARALAWRKDERKGEPYSAAVAGLQFELARAMTRGGRHAEGISQYERALEDMAGIDELHERRDLLERAKTDLREASAQDEGLAASPEIQQVLSRLEEAYEEVKAELEQAGFDAEPDEEWGEIASSL